MSWYDKVVWQDGMFLRAQHFQQQDRYLEHLLQARAAPLRPHPWGVTDLSLDRDLLGAGKFAIANAAGVLEDGTPFAIPHTADQPPPLDLPEGTRNAVVYLAAPLRQPGSTEVAFTEGPDININTRQNNNIAWRNMNIVDFFDLWFEDVELLVRSTSRGRFSLQIQPFNAATNPSFIQHGQVTVNLGEKLAQRWQAGGSKGTGFKVAERGTLVLTPPKGAVLENIELDPEFVDTMNLTFTRNEATPRERFFLSVRQVDARGVAVGGVSYEIRNDRSTVPTNPGDPD